MKNYLLRIDENGQTRVITLADKLGKKLSANFLKKVKGVTVMPLEDSFDFISSSHADSNREGNVGVEESVERENYAADIAVMKTARRKWVQGQMKGCVNGNRSDVIEVWRERGA